MRFKWVNIFTAVPVLKLGDTFSVGKTNVFATNTQAVFYPYTPESNGNFHATSFNPCHVH